MIINKLIAVAGATGFIGRHLVNAFLNRGDKVIIISRDVKKGELIFPNVKDVITYNSHYIGVLNKCHTIINLAGAEILKQRWTESYKNIIINSRINSTKQLIDLISKLDKKPECFINASAIGYYGSSQDITFTEDNPAGTDFLAQVCRKWEKEAEKVLTQNIRQVSVRIGIVLDKNGGALKKMLLPFYLFIGGPIANGKQWFSWIHIKDLIDIFLHAVDNQNITGSINASAPNPVTNKQFAQSLGKVLNRPSFFAVPKFALQLLYGEGANTLTIGNRVIPQKALTTGYKFLFPTLEEALKIILNVEG
ncbi:MAG: TIGR01777 family oxidoreductase [bacterium]